MAIVRTFNNWNEHPQCIVLVFKVMTLSYGDTKVSSPTAPLPDVSRSKLKVGMASRYIKLRMRHR